MRRTVRRKRGGGKKPGDTKDLEQAKSAKDGTTAHTGKSKFSRRNVALVLGTAAAIGTAYYFGAHTKAINWITPIIEKHAPSLTLAAAKKLGSSILKKMHISKNTEMSELNSETIDELKADAIEIAHEEQLIGGGKRSRRRHRRR